MGFVDWLKSIFGPKPVSRDVSELSAEDTSSDPSLTHEVIPEGGPLKAHHQRLALRDKRLLPKKKPKIAPFQWPRPKKPKVLDRQEADRLFSATLRARDRNLRDLVADKEQLERYGLPCWETEADVARALELTVSQLRHFSIHRQRETSPHYVTFAIPKRKGGRRLIHAPKRRLKGLQRSLNELLANKLPVSDSAHGFRAGHSAATNASLHVGKAVVIKLDLKDCFPSIHVGRVRGLLIALGYSFPVATVLAVLMTEAERQPVEVEGTVYHVPVGPRVCVQGAPTSPGLCNAILLRLDRRLAGLARSRGFDYSRYADDLTLSGDDLGQIKPLVTLAGKIVREEGFVLNRDKTRVMRKGGRQVVTGVVVNQAAGLSRKERRQLRATLHRLEHNPGAATEGELRRLRGKLAYLQMLSPDQARPLMAAWERING